MYFVLESAKLVQGSAQADQVCFARQPVVAIFDQDDQNLAAVEAFSEGDAGLPWHRFIAHAVKEPYRAVQCDWPGHYQVPLAVLKELAAKRVTGRVVFGGQSDRSGVLQRALLRLGEAGPEEGLSEIRRRSDPHQCMNPLGTGERRKERDPPTHARPNEDLAPLRQRIEDCDRILGPAANRSELGIPA